MDGIWRSVGVSLCMCLGILMMFCSTSGGGSMPVSGELQTELGGSHSGRDETGASVEEYIGEIYFRKYDSLDDSSFHNIVERELSSRSCEVHGDNSKLAPKLSLLKRHLSGEGSHRLLSTRFRLELPAESRFDIQVESCKVIFVERLPHGVFADPFELEHLQKRGVFKEASVFGDTNLELPSFLSNRSLVEVHVNVNLSCLPNGVDFDIELPLHGRYQPLDDSGYTKVEFGTPDIFLHCKMINLVYIKSCLSVLKDDGSGRRPKAITWSLPSGIKVHTGVVSVVTFSSAILSTLLIVFAAMGYLDIQKR